MPWTSPPGRAFGEAVKTGAAILAAPLTGTVKRVSDALIVEETTSRAGLFEAQTPQVFRKDMLLDAYARLKEEEEITDDAQAVELTGGHVSVVKSSPSNIKITTRDDMTLANAILKAKPTKPISRLGAFEEAQW